MCKLLSLIKRPTNITNKVFEDVSYTIEHVGENPYVPVELDIYASSFDGDAYILPVWAEMEKRGRHKPEGRKKTGDLITTGEHIQAFTQTIRQQATGDRRVWVDTVYFICINVSFLRVNDTVLIDKRTHPISDNSIEAVFQGSRAKMSLVYTGDIEAEYYLQGKKKYSIFTGEPSIVLNIDAQTPIVLRGDITEFTPLPPDTTPESGSYVLSIGGSSDVLLSITAYSSEELNSINLDGFSNIEDVHLLESHELPSINLSRNAKLRRLTLEDCALINNIDLSNNVLLEWITLNNTPISNIDLSPLSVLEGIECGGTMLQSIDISSNLQLTYCSILGCPNLTSVIMGENYALDDGLEFVNCPNVSTVTVRGVSQFIANRIAALIQRNSANAGTVYTNSADPYYSTIKTAALAYNWKVLLLNGWLSETTQNTILTAFGNSDGIAVVEDTNDYLDTLNAQDPTKATALASYIAEDPMMICSLGLQPTLTTLPSMPKRFLVAEGIVRILTDVNMGTPFNLETLGSLADAGWIFDCSGDTLVYFYGIARGSAGKWVCGLFAGRTYISSVSVNSQIHTFRHENGAYKVDNTTLTNSAFISNDTRYLRIALNNSITAFARLTDPSTGNQMHYFAPCIHNGQSGMYDIDAKIWKGKLESSSGSYSMVFKYYQNGQWVTWIPAS